MRNVLGELPVFLCCIYGGAVYGVAAFLLRLPRKLLDLKPMRRKLFVRILLIFLDLLLCIVGIAIVAFTLYSANGGELRFYTFLGFSLGGCVSFLTLNAMFLPCNKKRH